MPNRKGIPLALKTAKGQNVLSLEFIWKNNSAVMIVSYCPKPAKNVLLALHKKPLEIDFYNSQRCRIDVINQMLRDYSCQPTCDSWVLVVIR